MSIDLGVQNMQFNKQKYSTKIYKTSSIMLISLAFTLFGCAVGPDYVPPSSQDLNIPYKWHAKLPHNGNNTQLVNWWQQFNDPTLIYFIESTIASNPSLAQSLAKIAQAQANLRGSNSSFYPSITAAGNASAQNNAYNGTSIGGNTGTSSQDFISAATGGGSSYTGGLNASWELDLFGAIRRNTQIYQARLDASISDWNDARVSLASQVADAYVSARACQSVLMIYESQFNSRTATQKLTELQVAVGVSPRADQEQGAGLVAQTLSNIENQKGTCLQYNNELVALTGLKYDEIETKMAKNYAQIPTPSYLNISSIPANVISQRPDISSAERNVAAAMANVGYATANRYPSISLTGSLAANGGTIYANQPSSWSYGPAITLPITDGGYLRAQESLAYAQYDEAVANYKVKVLTAIKEVENALVRINAAQKREIAASDAVKNYGDYFNAMNKKYQIGWLNLLDLETVRINLVSYEQNLTTAKLEETEAWIALYKAVGGNWNESQLTKLTIGS